MTTARNWPETLWHASYKGVSFWFEQDEEQGGRGLVVHEFPNRDVPYVEDLGETARHYSGHAYVHGDDADAQAQALIAVLTAKGPGTLVIPLFGPVIVQAQPFRRKHEKDRQGFVAFEVRFVRDGAGLALITIASLANAAFGAADALASVAASSFAPSLRIVGEPGYVVEAASDGLAIAAAALDVIRTGNGVDPAASALVRDQISAIVAAAPAAFDPETVPGQAASDVVTSLVSAARALGDAMSPDAAAAAMTDMVDAFPAPSARAYQAPSEADWAVNVAATARVARLAALTSYADAIVRRTYASRPDGVSARGAASARFDAELELCIGAPDAELYIAIQNLRAAVVDYLTRLIADLKPVVTVETALQRPSLAMAWRLYADPLRSTELVARNRVRHPSFMPTEFQALAA